MSGTTLSSSIELDKDFLHQTLFLAYELVTLIHDDIKAFSLADLESEFHRNRTISLLTGSIGQFVEVTTLLSKLIMKQKGTQLSDIKESHIHLLFILKAMTQAQLKLDKVALEDLIKYELSDNLTQWKIDLIPQIKRLLNA
jgi:hypothetical protein